MPYFNVWLTSDGTLAVEPETDKADDQVRELLSELKKCTLNVRGRVDHSDKGIIYFDLSDRSKEDDCIDDSGNVLEEDYEK